MNKKTTLTLSIVVILLLCVSACMIPVAKHMYSSYMYFSGPSRLIEDEEKIVYFEKENKEYFETVNNDILRLLDEENEFSVAYKSDGVCSIQIFIENKGIKDVHGYPGEMPDDVFNSLNEIYGSFTSDFSYILVKDNFINYGGIGPTMYKYSINGDAPTFFFEEDDGMSFDAYKLSEHWYYLEANVHWFSYIMRTKVWKNLVSIV